MENQRLYQVLNELALSVRDGNTLTFVQAAMLDLVNGSIRFSAGEINALQLTTAVLNYRMKIEQMRTTCPKCHGMPKVKKGGDGEAKPCKKCGGNGWIWREGYEDGAHF